MDISKTLERLVRINSIARGFDGPGERPLADEIARVLYNIDPRVEVIVHSEDYEFRYIFWGPPDAEILLVAHLDTVQVDDEDELKPRSLNNIMYGRGTLDMKAGIVASLAAIERAQQEGRPRFAFLGVADEEDASRGAYAAVETLGDKLARFKLAIVTEPTQLRLVTAHRGFVWLEVHVRGRAAHGSLYQEGIDANGRMAHYLTSVANYAQTLIQGEPHAQLDVPSLHIAKVHGGSGPSTYADHCVAQIEWRTVEGQNGAYCKQQLETLARDADLDFPVEVRVKFERPSFCSARAPPNLLDALAREGLSTEPIGAPFWTDAALLQPFVPTVVLGPSGEGMHTAEEWVDLDSVECLARVIGNL